MVKRMKHKDFVKALDEIEKERQAICNRIIERAKELCLNNPEVVAFEGYFDRKGMIQAKQIDTDCLDTYQALMVINTIETELENQHPHKQTKIEFS